MSAPISGPWGNPFSDEDRLAFIDDVAEDPAFGEAANIEEVTLHWDVNFATTDIGAANQELIVDVMPEAAAAADNTFLTRMTQDPRLDGSNKVPGAMRILVGGIGCRTSMATVTTDLAVVGSDGTDPVVQADITAIQAAMDESIVGFENGAVRRFECCGDECFSYGAWRRVPETAFVTTATLDTVTVLAQGNEIGKDRGWKRLKPFEIGVDQQMTLFHVINRSSNWPAAFRNRYMMPTLLARVK